MVRALWNGEVIAESDDTAVRDLDDESFHDDIDGTITIADFWAPWCGPCKTLHEVFDQLAARNDVSVKFVRVDVDDNPGLASAFEIMSIPTILVFDRDGNEIDRLVGLPARRRLNQLVRRARARARRAPRSHTARTSRQLTPRGTS